MARRTFHSQPKKKPRPAQRRTTDSSDAAPQNTDPFVSKVLALQQTVGNQAVMRMLKRPLVTPRPSQLTALNILIQRESAEDTEKKLSLLQFWSQHDSKPGQLVTMLKKYQQHMLEKQLTEAYRYRQRVATAVLGLLKDLDNSNVLFKFEVKDKEAAKQSLIEWLQQLELDKDRLEDSKDQAIEEDRKQGRLIFREPPLTLPEAENIMDGLRQGKAPTNGGGLVVPEAMKDKLAQANQFEWGMGTIPGQQEEAVIIAGEATATPFPDFPYLTPRAHTHPVKEQVKGFIKRPGSCDAKKVLDGENIIFAVDLLPSKEDVDATADRKTPQTVFVNYKYDEKQGLIVNPAIFQGNTSSLPWINFIIGVPEIVEEKQPPLVALTMMAGGNVVEKWSVRKKDSTYWWDS